MGHKFERIKMTENNALSNGETAPSHSPLRSEREREKKGIVSTYPGQHPVCHGAEAPMDLVR